MRPIVCALIFLAALVPSALHALEITVFAAASLSDALVEIGKTYESASGDKPRFNFSGSSLLARQIKEGAPADLFFSADEARMNELVRANLIVEDTHRTLLSNTLVIVVHNDSPVSLRSSADLASPGISRIALGEPSTVPIGVYAKTYLQKNELWEKLSAKIIPTENVRAALAAVESGNADAAFVYKTDAIQSKHARIACEIPAAEGPKISYPLAVVKGAKNAEAARKFAAYLASPAARAVFEKYGFLPAPQLPL